MTPTKVTPPASKRGKHEPKHKLPQETVSEIKEHIRKYNPACSHYRRAHAPKRLYLPTELSITDMHKEFSENSSGLIHYSTYQKVVQSMNIGFAKLGEEECETCEEYRYFVCLKKTIFIRPKSKLQNLSFSNHSISLCHHTPK